MIGQHHSHTRSLRGTRLHLCLSRLGGSHETQPLAQVSNKPLIPKVTEKNSKMAEPTRRVVWGRRFLAGTVVVPLPVANHLNLDAMAVLAVIRNEASTSGRCTVPVARIAERANIGRAKVRAAIRLAEKLGLITIEETPDRKRVIINRGITSRC